MGSRKPVRGVSPLRVVLLGGLVLTASGCSSNEAGTAAPQEVSRAQPATVYTPATPVQGWPAQGYEPNGARVTGWPQQWPEAPPSVVYPALGGGAPGWQGRSSVWGRQAPANAGGQENPWAPRNPGFPREDRRGYGGGSAATWAQGTPAYGPRSSGYWDGGRSAHETRAGHEPSRPPPDGYGAGPAPYGQYAPPAGPWGAYPGYPGWGYEGPWAAQPGGSWGGPSPWYGGEGR